MPLPVVSPTAEHLDPELLELFIEEAKEEIASIRRNLPTWTASPDDLEALITVRRSFHTLKGSGRMVGAERIGEYCWAVEDLLNRLINRTLKRTPPMVEFVTEAASAVPELVEQLEVGSEPKADISLLIARANAFSEGDPNAAVLEIGRKEGEAAVAEQPALEMDPVLYDVFSKETTGHLKVITDYLEACEGHQPPFDVTDKLYRACHTLHGSANMANVDRGVAVAAALNRFVRKVYDRRVGFQKSGLDALRAAARAINTIVGDINNPDRNRADYTALIDHIRNLTDAIQTEPTMASVPEAAAPTPTRPPTPAPEPVVERVSDEPEYDAEIAAIFTEESAELLESADKALLEWVKERSSQSMEELKRHLHTLKGGARMAGITAMGNLSHEIETLLISVNDGRVKATPAVEDLLQASIDELHRMRDLVIAGKPVNPVAELGNRIQQANAGFEVAEEIELEPAPDDTSVEEAPFAKFTIEPDDTVSMVIVDSPLADDLAAWMQRRGEPAKAQFERALGDDEGDRQWAVADGEEIAAARGLPLEGGAERCRVDAEQGRFVPLVWGSARATGGDRLALAGTLPAPGWIGVVGDGRVVVWAGHEGFFSSTADGLADDDVRGASLGVGGLGGDGAPNGGGRAHVERKGGDRCRGR